VDDYDLCQILFVGSITGFDSFPGSKFTLVRTFS